MRRAGETGDSPTTLNEDMYISIALPGIMLRIPWIILDPFRAIKIEIANHHVQYNILNLSVSLNREELYNGSQHRGCVIFSVNIIAE